MADMQLSPNFMLSEFLVSQTAARLGIDNTPPPAHLENLEQLCLRVLEPVRAILGKPMLISSGYRSRKVNEAVPGSAKESDHMYGQAADFTCPGFGSVRQICDRLKDETSVPFYQLIREFDRDGGGWVHISWRDDRPPVRQALIIDQAGTRPLTA